MMGRKRRRSGKDLLIPDPVLLSRLNNYLESKKHEVTIDQNKMVEDLRCSHKDYERKDKTAFRASVFRAYNYILKPLVNPSSIHSQDNDDESSVESCSNDEEVLDSDDMGDDVQVLDPKEDRSKNNGNVAYLQNLQNMTNPGHRLDDGMCRSSERESNGKETPVVVSAAIDISSDDDEECFTSRHASPPKSSKFLPSAVNINRNYDKGMNNRPLTLTSNPISISLVPRTTADPLVSHTSSEQFKNLTPRPKRKSVNPLFPSAKRRKDNDLGYLEEVPKLKLKDFGGYQKIYESLSCLLEHIKSPEVYCTLGVSPPIGFLLHGPPGSGKSLLAQCIAGELNLPLMKVVGPELVSGISGESEQRIRMLFESAMDMSPCVLFIDEIDAISQPRESASKDMERRIVAQLLASFDELQSKEVDELVIVIGATNRADSLDPALRRAGRFDREITVGMPDRQTRVEILKLVCDSVRLSPSLDMDRIAAVTPGYVGADLKALTTQAAYQAVNRFMKFKEETKLKIPTQSIINEEKKDEKQTEPLTDSSAEKVSEEKETEEESMVQAAPSNEEKSSQDQDKAQTQTSICNLNETSDSVTVVESGLESNENLEELYIEEIDFMKALKSVQPSAKREGFATVPDVTWSDIGSLDLIREQLNLSIMMPVKYPEEFARFGITSPTGVLLCGPPGCGKTLLAKAVANEANINFISVKGPELLNMYVGESEKAVRQVFQRARNSQPCVIFFDEIDALCPKRSDSAEGGGRAGSRVVNQLLTEMDGVEGGRVGVYMMAATNRPDMLDPAVLRPGRFDKILYVGLPSPADRALILKAITKNGSKPEFTREVDLDAVGCSEKCEGFSGADLSALIKEASIQALSEYIKNNKVGDLKVSNKHITLALGKVKASVSPQERLKYNAYRLQYLSSDFSDDRMEEDD